MAALLTLWLTGGAAAARIGDSWQDAMAATVRIVTGELEKGQFRGQASGAGVVITPQGGILTTRQAIQLADGRLSPVLWALTHESGEAVGLRRALRLKVLAVSGSSDLALLQIVFRPGRESVLPSVRLALGERIEYGARVSLFGFTGATGSSVIHRSLPVLDVDDRDPQADWLMVEGEIDPQSTGGPVFNSQGRLIGLQTTIRQPRSIPFLGDEDLPIGQLDPGPIGYLHSAGTLVGFLLDPAAAPLGLTDLARPSAIQIVGRVRDALTGESVPGAVIGVLSAKDLARTPILLNRELMAFGRSDSHGRFEASRRVPPARYFIKVAHPLYETVVKEVMIGSHQRDLTIDLVRN
jgi:hypothetical protein